jgi:hypothetical protein
MIPTKSSRSYSLLYFDEEKNENRPLRYARNQKSPFEDEQDGSAILEPIVFEDGMLVVPRDNQVLQKFLHHHPGNGMIFTEVDKAKDATKELESVERVLDAQILAKNLSTEKLISVSRILMGNYANNMTIPELKRDILVYAQNNPEDLMEVVNDPMLELQNDIREFFDQGFIAFRNNQRDIYYSLPSNKKKMLSVPFNEDPYSAVAAYLQSNDGLDAYKFLKKKLKKD